MPLIILALTFVIFLIVFHRRVGIPFLGKGKRGELIAASFLSSLPEKEYLIINDLMLKNGDYTSQIDHVVVSKCGVFVIETKNYQGIITGGENSGNWTQNIYGHKYSLYNPVFQNQSHLSAVRKILRDNGKIKMISIVAFSGSATLRVMTGQANVIYSSQLPALIRSYSDEVLTSGQVQTIYTKLAEANVVDREARRLHKKDARAQAQKTERKIASRICPRCGGARLLPQEMRQVLTRGR